MPPAVESLAEEFARAMAALGPFEPQPHLAVAVSGGADSLALCLLAHAWAVAAGGRVTALSVDHQLRPEAGDEASQVGRWLAARGIAHRILSWAGAKPATGIQAAARAARYRLLCEACREAGVLHLLLAHHTQDQAETVLLRVSGGSGVHGLAGMQPAVATPHCRILRPLLQTDPARLRRILVEADQPWIEDPSNRSSRFARVRVRRALPSLAAAGLGIAALARIAAAMQDARTTTDAATARWLATSVACHEAGYAEIDLPRLREAPRFVAVRVLSRLITTIGGGRWEPDEAAVHRVFDRIAGTAGGAVTLGRCRLHVRGGSLLVCRERRNLPPPLPLPLPAGAAVHWDGRFDIAVEVGGPAASTAVRLQALGSAPIDARTVPNPAAVPKVVWPSLPALADDQGIAHVPHLGYLRESPICDTLFARVVFLPRRCLSDSDSFIV